MILCVQEGQAGPGWVLAWGDKALNHDVHQGCVSPNFSHRKITKNKKGCNKGRNRPTKGSGH